MNDKEKEFEITVEPSVTISLKEYIILTEKQDEKGDYLMYRGFDNALELIKESKKYPLTEKAAMRGCSSKYLSSLIQSGHVKEN